jgi:hypothetical protein
VKYKSVLIFSFLLNSIIFSQNDFNGISVSDSFSVNLQNKYYISSTNIIPFTENIFVNGNLIDKKSYKIDYVNLFFSLADTLSYRINDRIVIKYNSVLTNFRKQYLLRAPKKLFTEKSDNPKNILQSDLVMNKESIFGKSIQSSGAIIRGFTVGTNKDFTLNSGLRLQLSGKLSDEIEIVAALTDENTPIQPEGNTERLDELDKVYIEIRHPNVTLNFGDYDLNSAVGEFGKINRKLQGLKLSGKYNQTKGEIAIASSKGKFNSLSFFGNDGNQGPYRLFGSNSEKDIIIIAGSEKVYLDGQILKRGENNDYIIEYSNAQITFTNKRMITSASRIVIDYEYTDRQYQRNFFGTTFQQKLFDDKINFTIGYFREADDFENPIDLNLSENDIKTLSQAGDDISKAYVSGIAEALQDSSGLKHGTYSKVDTLINNVQFSYYKYNPGSSDAIYFISFTFVGEGKGDYKQKSFSEYQFVGIGMGNYLPIKLISLPESKQITSMAIYTKPIQDLSFSLELAGSNYDKNRLSKIDDNDNIGFGRNTRLSYSTKKLNLLNTDFGEIDFSFRERFVDKYFKALDRFNTSEFARDYNLPDNLPANESLQEVSLQVSPTEKVKTSFLVGSVKKGKDFQSKRFLTDVSSAIGNADLNYKIDFVSSKNILTNTDWAKQNADVGYTVSFFKPGIQFYDEKRLEKKRLNSDMLSTSFRYYEFGPYLQIISLSGFNSAFRYSGREEYFPFNNKLEKESFAVTKQISINYNGVREVNSNIDFTYRKKEFTKLFQNTGSSNNTTFLLKSNTRVTLFNNGFESNLFYSAATQKSAKYERIFVRVEKGQGNFIYLGDLNGNGINDENEFEPSLYDGEYIVTMLPTDEMFPVIDLKTNFRFVFSFDKLFSNTSLIKYVKPFSTETVIRIEENSKTNNIDKIYWLKLSEFLNEQTTIRGNQYFQNDFYVFKNSNDFSVRTRFIEKRSLNQFSGGTEKGFYNEKNVRVKIRLLDDVGNQTDFIFAKDVLSASSVSNRERQYNSFEFVSDFSYKPYNVLEIGFKFSLSSGKDKKPVKPTAINQNAQGVRINLSFVQNGRLRIEGERNELLIENVQNNIPFEITRGNSNGKNYFWSVNFDYKIGMYLQTTVSYNGRLQGKSDIVNLLKAEARAFF